MKIHTTEELEGMSVKQAETYYQKLHEENRKVL